MATILTDTSAKKPRVILRESRFLVVAPINSSCLGDTCSIHVALRVFAPRTIFRTRPFADEVTIGNVPGPGVCVFLSITLSTYANRFIN